MVASPQHLCALKLGIQEEDMSMLLDAYANFKTDDDHKESVDVIVVLVPGAPCYHGFEQV